MGRVRTSPASIAKAVSMGIPREKLPVRYLGLPLTTKNMTKVDYEPLVDRIRTRFISWTNRFLSCGGRLMLIKSVIASTANFWCSVFRLPQRCLDQIEGMCSAFLWSGSPHITTKSKVKWEDVCSPKCEGGLGIRKLRDTSLVFSLSLIWRLLSSSRSIWVSWTKRYLLRYSSFWDVKSTISTGSWIWRKLLKLRPIAMDFFRYEIHDGTSTFFWHDRWIGDCSLINKLGENAIRALGLNREACVSDAAASGEWTFRRCRGAQFQAVLAAITVTTPPNSEAGSDVVLWKIKDDEFKNMFSLLLLGNRFDRLEKLCLGITLFGFLIQLLAMVLLLGLRYWIVSQQELGLVIGGSSNLVFFVVKEMRVENIFSLLAHFLSHYGRRWDIESLDVQ